MKLVKTTILKGYYATGDYESFAFSRLETPQQINDCSSINSINSYNDEVEESINGDYIHPEPCIYASDLIPDDQATQRLYGNWKITVEFESTSEEFALNYDNLVKNINEALADKKLSLNKRREKVMKYLEQLEDIEMFTEETK